LIPEVRCSVLKTAIVILRDDLVGGRARVTIDGCRPIKIARPPDIGRFSGKSWRGPTAI